MSGTALERRFCFVRFAREVLIRALLQKVRSIPPAPIAITHGKEAVLTAIFGTHVSNPHETGFQCSVDCAIKSVVARALDYLNSLDTSGRPVSKDRSGVDTDPLELEDICRKLRRENPPGTAASE